MNKSLSNNKNKAEKLHHAHNKIIQVALQETEARREFTDKFVMPQLKGIKIDLDNLQLDTTSYVSPAMKASYLGTTAV